MEKWMQVATIGLPFMVVLVLIVMSVLRCRRGRRSDVMDNIRIARSESLQAGIAKLHLDHHNSETKRRVNYYVLRRGSSVKPWFNWADHPSLVSEAVEHGWARFGFNGYTMSSSASTRSVLLGLCVSGDQAREIEADISWELCPDSADFMQRIRMNSGLRKISWGGNGLSANSVIKTGLPLPGPPLGNSTFPQEAYFEITIVSSPSDDIESNRKFENRKVESDMVKLMQGSVGVSASHADSLVHVTSRSGNKKLDEMRLGDREEAKGDAVMLSLGLTQGGSLPLKLPGTYSGSTGFNSNGSVYLDGIKLIFEAEKAEWARPGKVIGCGFDPAQKKVFFTVDSELVLMINCKSEEFSSPLYPTLAANADVTVLVNFGQSAFKFAPANVHRTPNPCFIGALVNARAATLGYEDSRELFSMGRIDAEWLNRSATKSSQNTVNYDNVTVDIDEESEADLFEIVLDRMNKSPSTALDHHLSKSPSSVLQK